MVTRLVGHPSLTGTEDLVPDVLRELWQRTAQNEITWEEYEDRRSHLLSRYADLWSDALILGDAPDVSSSLVSELSAYVGEGSGDVRERCEEAEITVSDEWRKGVTPQSRASVERFYDESEAYLYDLMWWHTLTDDNSPLGYVLALDFARRHGCRTCLDFGCGVASGGILFERNGLDVTNADISSVLLAFSAWRLNLRGLPLRLIDTKLDRLPQEEFDIVTVMDTFEHLVDPVDAVEKLWESLKCGGFLFGRFHTKEDDDRPQHIVRDFGPTLERMRSLGLVEVWRDDWVWGHQVFQKL
jgi:SAM-dependent methyltransferase